MAPRFPLPRAMRRQRAMQLLRFGAACAIVIALIAVVLLARGGAQPHVPLLIASALGIGLFVLLALAAMTLIFLGNRKSDAHAPSSERDKT